MHPKYLEPASPRALTYTLTVDSCEDRPKIHINFYGVKQGDIMVAFNVAKSAFRQVEILNEETGEVVTTYYMSDEFHRPSRTYGDAINYLTKFCYEVE